MADEPNKEHPEDIESILSDLDAILTDMGGAAPVAPKPAAPVEAAKPIELPKAVAPPAPVPPPAPIVIPKAVEAPKVVPPPPPPPAPVEPVVAPKANPIELAPREGMLTPPVKKPEPQKPAPKLPDQKPIELTSGTAVTPPAPAVPAPPPAKAPEPVKAAAPVDPMKAPPTPTAVPAPAPVVASTKIEELPADAPKEQIRRVAYVYTAACSEVKVAFGAFLSQAARTISKKPLYLREVLSHEVVAASDPNAIVQKALQAKASSVLAVVDGWPSAKVDELSEACSRANLLFRSVAPADAQKKSTAVDVIVDMMLLPGEN